MKYADAEADVIIADSFDQFNYRQKKLFLAAQRADNPDRRKYAEALIKTCGESVYNNAVETFSNGDYRRKVFAAIDKNGVTCVTLKSETYPQLLKHTPAPPLVLYCRGKLDLLGEDKFAVVGSRKTNAQMTEECRKLSSAVAEKLVIVTGVADGADRAAAAGAINSGRLICVLPGGHRNPCAPDPNFIRRVEENGLTVSEFPPHIPARRYTFILRNRIIAGLCRGVLVVSAPEKSGALSTASYAADYGREVFAFPYGLGVTSGEGCNALIKKGATLCTGAEDILTAFGIQCEVKEELPLTPEEAAVTTLLKEQGELHVERIAAALGKSLPQTASVCSMLEIRGIIIKTGGNKYGIV